MNEITGISTPWTSQKSDSSRTSLLGSLQKHYPHLKLSAQSFSGEAAIRQYAQGQSGKYNVAIDPRALARMETDPEFSDHIHGILGGVKEMDDLSERMTNAMGARVVARGTIIDKDGNVGYWGVVQTGDGKESSVNKKSHKELMEELQEKRHARKAEQEQLQEQKQAEEDVGSLEVEASVEVSGKGGEIGAAGLDITA